MGKVLHFPRRHTERAVPVAAAVETPVLQRDLSLRGEPLGRRLWNAGVCAVWVLIALIWPVLKWIVAMEVFFQFMRMLWHWNTPDSNAGWQFGLHFVAFTAITYFVMIFRPANMRGRV